MYNIIHHTIWSDGVCENVDVQAKASLGFGPSTALEDITEEKMQLKFGQRLAEVSGLSLGERKYFLFTLKINFRLSKLLQSSTSLINGNFSITIQPLGRLWADKNTPRSLPVSDAEEEEEVRAQYGGELGQGRRKSLDIESCQTTWEELNTSLKKLFINLSVPLVL